MVLKSVFFFGLIALVSSIELPEEIQEYINDLHNICIQKSGITEEDHGAYDIKNHPHDEKLQCYMKCLMLESKWMSPDGIIQYEFILKNAHPDIKDVLEEAINKCRNIQDDPDLCKKSSNFNACMYEADPENWFLA